MTDRQVVLIVDDDPDVRQSLIQALEHDGMTVVEAASGQEALRILASDPTIRVMLADIMMPGITGITLAERAAGLRPDVKVVLVTGYARTWSEKRQRSFRSRSALSSCAQKFERCVLLLGSTPERLEARPGRLRPWKAISQSLPGRGTAPLKPRHSGRRSRSGSSSMSMWPPGSDMRA
jgi:CheY-like chemotaxis protein